MLYIQSIIVYTMLALLMCYGAYRSQGISPKSQLWGWLPVVLFTFVFGLRYGVGVDYNNYVEIYEETDNYSSFFELLDSERYELGFSLLLYLCHLLHAPVWFLFTIIAFIQISLLYKAFKDEGNILIYIYATFILTGFCVANFMNILRHEIAFCIFLYSLKYIRSKQLIRYWICCFLALAFHHSALLLFPIYFVWIKRSDFFRSPLIELAIVLVCFASSFFSKWQDFLHLFDNLITLLGYEQYLDTADNLLLSTKIGITRIFYLVINILIIVNSREIKAYYKSDLLNMIYNLYIVGISLGYVFMGSMMLMRAIVFFNHTQFIIWAYTLCYYYHVRRVGIKQYAKYIAIVLFVFYSYSTFIFRSMQNTDAYVFYFQENLHATKDQLRQKMMDNRP